MSHIFVSYSRTDLDQAQKIVSALAVSKLDTWIDWKSIPKGEDWEQEIYRGIEAADAFLFLLSEASAASEMCNQEIAHAVRNGKRILPIFIADVADREMYDVVGMFIREKNKVEISRRNFIKCRAGRDDFDTAVKEIRTTIQTDYEWLKYHTRLQVKSLEWERRKDDSRLLRGKELQEAEQQLATVGNQKDPQPTPDQRQYVLAGRTHEDRMRRRTITGLSIGFVVLAVLCVAAVIASVIAIEQRNIAVIREEEANEARLVAEQERRIALSNGLATQARLLFDGQLDLALLLSVLSGQIHTSPDAMGSLHDALEHRPDLVQYLNGVPPAGVTRLAYTPDGQQLFAIGVDGSIWRWDLDTGQLAGGGIQTPGQWTLGLTMGPRGETWIISLDDNRVFVWDAASNEKLASDIVISGDADGDGRIDLPHIATLSPDGDRLAIAIYEKIYIWDVQNGQLLGASDVFLGFPPSALEFSPDGNTLASAGNEWQIYLWDAFSGINLDIWETSQTRNITSLSFSADGRYIASGSVDGTVNLFDLGTGEQILRQPRYSITTGQEVPPPVLGHPSEVRSVALSPDGKTLISGAADGNLLIWDTNTMIPYAVPKPAYVGPIRALAWHPDDGSFSVGGENGSITVWQPVENWRLLRPKDDAELDLVFVHDITQTTETDEQNMLRVIHNESGYSAASGCNEAVEYYEPCSAGFVQAYQPDGQLIELQPAELNNRPNGLTFNHNGTMLAVATCRTMTGYDCLGSDIWIWDLPVGSLRQYETSVQRINRLLFSPNGRHLALGGEGMEILLIDLDTDRQTHLSLLNLPGLATGLAFSPDGTRLTASASFEDPGPYANTIHHGRIVVWDTLSGQVIAQGYLWGSTAGEPAFTEDGRLLSYIIQEGNEYPFQIWVLGFDQWQEIACRIANRNLTEGEWERYVVGEEYRRVCP
jgi:WD40 repeat protein